MAEGKRKSPTDRVIAELLSQPEKLRELIEAGAKAPKNAQQAALEASMAELAKLGGQHVTDESVMHAGTRLILPESMSERGAIEFLEEYIESQETETAYSRTFRYRPFDVAAAFQRALARVFGSSGVARATWTFFGKRPPELISINVGPHETLSVPWGRISVPAFNGVMSISSASHKEWGLLGAINITAPRKYKAHIEGLFNVIEEELRSASIYKGKAIDGQVEPEFMDLDGVDPEQVIYSEDTTVQLEANIWSVLRYTNVMRGLNIPRKRAVLLEGPYGTGKTLAAFLTAQEAVRAGWTFIYCRPAKDDLFQVMTTARLYQPAVVFFEDVDVLAESAERDVVSQLLDMFDGITAKGTEILAVLTTNHKERIHRAMIRPGRLDALVHIGALDRHGIERMIRSVVPDALLDPQIDYEETFKAMKGFLPAFVKEAIDRTMRYAISRAAGEVRILTTEDFVQAATGLRPQLELMEGASEGVMPDSLGSALERKVRDAVDGTLVIDREQDPMFTLASPNGE